jgi:hypothetical protein
MNEAGGAAAEAFVDVPSDKVGWVLGPKWTRLKALQKEFNCLIEMHVPHEDRRETRFYIRGNDRNPVQSCRSKVEKILVECGRSNKVEKIAQAAGVDDDMEGLQNLMKSGMKISNTPARLIEQPKRLTVPEADDVQVVFLHRLNELQITVPRDITSALKNEQKSVIEKVQQAHAGSKISVKLIRSENVIVIKFHRWGRHVGAMEVAKSIFLHLFGAEAASGLMGVMKEKLKLKVDQFRDEDDPLPLWCAGGICVGNTEVSWDADVCGNGHKVSGGFEKALGKLGDGYIFCRYCPGPIVNRKAHIKLKDGRFKDKNPLLLNKCPNMDHFDHQGNIRTYHAAWVSSHGVLLH